MGITSTQLRLFEYQDRELDNIWVWVVLERKAGKDFWITWNPFLIEVCGKKFLFV